LSSLKNLEKTFHQLQKFHKKIFWKLVDHGYETLKNKNQDKTTIKMKKIKIKIQAIKKMTNYKTHNRIIRC
jgi:hypothetical protein